MTQHYTKHQSREYLLQPIDGEEEAAKQQADVDPTKFSGKKSKAAAKQGTAATQWGILAASGIPVSELPNFRCQPCQPLSCNSSVRAGGKDKCIYFHAVMRYSTLSSLGNDYKGNQASKVKKNPVLVAEIPSIGCTISHRSVSET